MKRKSLKLFFLLFGLIIQSESSFAAGFRPITEILGSRSIAIPATDAEHKLDYIYTNLSSVFEIYRPALDSNSSIVSGPTISGTLANPIYEVQVKKCVFRICESVNLNAFSSASRPDGTCALNYQVDIDLSRSSTNLADIYKMMTIQICGNPNGDQMSLALDFTAYRSEKFSTGIKQREILSMLKLQLDPMTKSMLQVLESR